LSLAASPYRLVFTDETLCSGNGDAVRKTTHLAYGRNTSFNNGTSFELAA